MLRQTAHRYSGRAAVAAVALLTLVALLLRWWAERGIVTPWYQDEFRYAEAARDIAGQWSALVHGFSTYFYLYPRLIAPAWAAGAVSTTYAVAKAVNVVLITAAVVPVFLWARRLVSPWYAALAAALVLALPTGLYSGALVTENAFFPALVLAAFALAWTLELPTPGRQVATAAAVVLASAVRPQGIVFVPIIASSIVLKAAIDVRQTGERPSLARLAAAFRPYLVLLGLLVAGAGAYALRQILTGAHLSGGLGIYSFVVRVQDYSVTDVVKWTVYHFAGIALAVGVVPFVALVLLVAEAWRRDARMTAAERSFVAVAASATFWLVVQVGIYVSRWFPRMSERYMFHAEPLLVLALVVWIGRGAPRPRRALALVLAVGLPVTLVLALPFERLAADQGILSDAFSFVALNRWAQSMGGTQALWVILVVVAAAAGVFVLSGSRRVVTVLAPALVLAYLVSASLSVVGPIHAYARGVLAGAGITDASWVDRAVGRQARVVLVYVGDPEPERAQTTILLNEFWNRSIRAAYRAAPASVCCVTWTDASIDPGSGLIRSAAVGQQPGYAVFLPPTAQIAGTPVTRANGLTLVRPTSPLRLVSRTSGVYSDGWMATSATYDRFAGGSPVLRVVVSRAAWKGPDVPGRVQVSDGPLWRGASLQRVDARRTWIVHSRSMRTFVLHPPRPPYRVAVHIAPAFSPSKFGIPDARYLGAQVLFGPP